MRIRRLAPLLLVAVVLGMTALALVEPAPVTADETDIEGITWLTDLDKARALARDTGRPILAVFR